MSKRDGDKIEGGGAADAASDSKKPRWMNEDDLDFMIGDLTREEAHLVITRILRNHPTLTDFLKDQISLVRHSRASLSLEQLQQQVQQLQQLAQLRTAHLAAPVPAFGSGGGGFPFAVGGGGGGDVFMFGAGGGGAGAGGGVAPGAPLNPAMIDGMVRGSRSNIQAAFRKVKGLARGIEKFTIDLTVVEGELNKVKERLLAAQQRVALSLLEGITEEVSNKVYQLQEQNVDNHKEIIARLAKEWLEAFLTTPSDLDEKERKEWSAQLRSWDSAGNENDGVFAPARSAAINGWDNPNLEKVLAGEEPAARFTEHPGTIVARLTILEREKKFQEALNLSTHCELSQHRARFLVKLGRVEEAIESAKSMTDARTVFTTAQLARSLDKNAAFTLTLRALSIDRSGWNSDNEERGVWLSELVCEDGEGAASSALLAKLVDEMTEVVKDKRIIFAVAQQLFNAKKRPREALALAERSLRPFSDDELRALYTAQEQRRIAALPPALQATETIVLPATRAELLSSIPGSSVPSSQAVWMWESAFQTSVEGGAERDVALEERVIDAILREVEDHKQLSTLMEKMRERRQYASVRRVGYTAVTLIHKQSEKHQEYQELVTRERFTVQELNRKEGEPVPVYQPPAPVGHFPIYNFDDEKLKICQQILNAAVENKQIYLNPPAPEVALPVGSPPVEEPEEQRAIRLEKLRQARKEIADVADMFLSKIARPQSLTSLATSMASKEEFRLALRITDRCYERIRALEEEYARRRVWLDELNVLKNEVSLLMNGRLTVPPEKLKRYRDLELQSLLLNLLPAYARSDSEQGLRNLHLNCAKAAVQAAVSSTQCLIVEERVSQDELASIVIDRALTFVHDHTSLKDLIRLASSLGQHAAVIQVGRRLVESVRGLLGAFVIRSRFQVELDLLNEEVTAKQLAAASAAGAGGAGAGGAAAAGGGAGGASGADIDPAIKSRIEQLSAELAKLPERPNHAPDSYQGHSDVIFDAVRSMMDAAIQGRNDAQILVDTPSLEDTPERRAQLNADLTAARANVDAVFAEILPILEDPEHLHDLAKSLARSGTAQEIPLAVQACRAALKTIREVVSPAASARAPLIVEERYANQALTEAVNARQTYPADKMSRLRELRLETALANAGPRHLRTALASIDRAITVVFATLLNSVIQSRRSLLLRQNRELELADHTPSPAAIAAAGGFAGGDVAVAQQAFEADVAKRREQRAQNIAELKSLNTVLSQSVEYCVEHASSPEGFQQIGTSLALSLSSDDAPETEDSDVVMGEAAGGKGGSKKKAAAAADAGAAAGGDAATFAPSVLRFTQVVARIFPLCDELEAERVSRLDNAERLQQLREEIATTTNLRKPVAPEVQAEFLKLSQEADLLALQSDTHQKQADPLCNYAVTAAQLIMETLLGLQANLKDYAAMLIEREDRASRGFTAAAVATADGDFVMVDAASAAAAAATTTTTSSAAAATAGAEAEDVAALRRERERIQKRAAAVSALLLDNLQTIILHRIQSPQHLVAVMKLGHGRPGVGTLDESAIGLIAKRVFLILDQLGEEEASRVDQINELAQLRKSKAELAAVLKTLPAAQEKRWKELEHLDYGWQREPSFHRLDWTRRENIRAEVVNLWLGRLLQLQTNAVSELQQVTIYSDIEGRPLGRPDVSKAQLQSLIERLQPLIEEAIQQGREQLKNPGTLFQVATALFDSQEYERCISVCKFVVQRSLELDEQRVDAAKAERLLTNLLRYRVELAARRAAIPAELVERIQEAQKAVEAIPDLRFADVAPVRPISIADQAAVAENSNGVEVAIEDCAVRYDRAARNLESHINLASKKMLSAVLWDLENFEKEVQNDAVLEIPRDIGNVTSDRAAIIARIDDVAAFLVENIRNFEILGNSLLQDLRRPVAGSSSSTSAAPAAKSARKGGAFSVSSNNNNNALPSGRDMQREKEDGARRSAILLSFGEKALQVLEEYREAQLARALDSERELATLRQEKVTMQGQRKQLAADKEQRLQDLIYEKGDLESEQLWTHYTINQYDNAANKIGELLMTHAQERLTKATEAVDTAAINPRLLRRDSIVDEATVVADADAELEAAKTDLNRVMDLITTYVHDVRNLIKATQHLNNCREYGRVIFVGTKTQAQVRQQLEERMQFDAMLEKRRELEEKVVQGAQLPAELVQLMSDIKDMEPKISPNDAGSLRRWVLQLADVLIDAARLEGSQPALLREQTVLVFKMTLTADKFEEVRTLTAADEWPAVRTELLKCLSDHNTLLPGSPITARQQVELLLKEGMWKEACAVFPKAAEVSDTSDLIALLELLWIEVEKQGGNKELKKLLDKVEDYARKEYTSFEIASLDRLFDRVQQTFPEFIPKIYNMGCEILLANIGAKQYDDFVRYMKTLRRRLVEDLNRKSAWDDFNAAIRREHSRKKKLIQVLNVAGLD